MTVRVGYFLVGTLVGVFLGTAIVVSHADPAEAEVQAAATQANVDPTDLQGAMNSTGLGPFEYLRAVGELPSLAPVPKLPPVPPPVGALARADCIIDAESGRADVPNRQGSGASGPGQYFPSTWITDTRLYRAATGYTGSLSLHSLADVRRVMAFILANYPGKRSQWTVGGC